MRIFAHVDLRRYLINLLLSKKQVRVKNKCFRLVSYLNTKVNTLQLFKGVVVAAATLETAAAVMFDSTMYGSKCRVCYMPSYV